MPPKGSRGALQPLQRINLVQTVAERLRTQILKQRFGPDGIMPTEWELGELFDVSRTVIREAMRTLSGQGLIEVSQGRVSRVRPADPQAAIYSLQALLCQSQVSLPDLVEARRSLECEIASLAANRATKDQLDRLEQAIAALESAGSPKQQVQADVRFHGLLAEASGNSVFPLILKTLTALLRQSREKSITRTSKRCAVLDHRAILQALRHHRPEAARAAMLKHLGIARHHSRR